MAERNFENRTLYHGDNLPFLRGLNSGTVNLIATDPPFNKNKDFHATPGSLASGAQFQDRWRWDEDIHDDWLIAIQRDEPEVWSVITTAKQVWGDDMGAFLCWLGVRLLEMRRILADDGSLYLHIDHTAHAWVKTLLDAIFGRRNFQNEIIWYYSGGGASRRRFARKHDTILFYSKSDEWTFDIDAVRTPHKWTDGQLRADGTDRSIADGKIPDDVIPLHGVMPWAKERTGYPTQKPLALYERIIKASSNPDDLVLDPFCGCATTPVAAERLGRQWVGMDIWDGAITQVLDRLEQEQLLVKGQRKRGQQALMRRDIHYETTPPPGRTAANLPRSPCGRRRAAPSGCRRPGRITGGCWPTLARSVRAAGRIISLTREYWRLITSTHALKAARTPTRTSRCYARPATGKSGTATRSSACSRRTGPAGT